jgi:hypothetical protein
MPLASVGDAEEGGETTGADTGAGTLEEGGSGTVSTVGAAAGFGVGAVSATVGFVCNGVKPLAKEDAANLVPSKALAMLRKNAFRPLASLSASLNKVNMLLAVFCGMRADLIVKGAVTEAERLRMFCCELFGTEIAILLHVSFPLPRYKARIADKEVAEDTSKTTGHPWIV